MMVRHDDMAGLIKRLLLDAFPGMRFDVELSNPRYARTSTYQSIRVTYHEEVARERDITQRDMRAALQDVLDNDEVHYGTKTFSTLYLKRLSFTKKQFQVPSVNPERVQEIVAALSQARAEESSSDAVLRTVEVLTGFLPRAQQPLLVGVVEALKDDVVAE